MAFSIFSLSQGTNSALDPRVERELPGLALARDLPEVPPAAANQFSARDAIHGSRVRCARRVVRLDGDPTGRPTNLFNVLFLTLLVAGFGWSLSRSFPPRGV